MRWLDSIINSMDMNLRKLPETVEDRGTRHATVHEIAKNWTRLTTEQQKRNSQDEAGQTTDDQFQND